MATCFVVIYEGDYLDPKVLQATVNALGYCTELCGKTLFPKMLLGKLVLTRKLSQCSLNSLTFYLNISEH